MESCSDCVLYVNSSSVSIPTILVAPGILFLYILAYASPRVRASASFHAGAIAREVLPDVRMTVTVLALTVAGIAILSRVGKQEMVTSVPIEKVFEWLAAATLFTIAQLLLTRHVTRKTSYLASAATDSLWWCLTWAIWLLYQILLPNRAWVIIMGIAPIGVLSHSLLNLYFLYRDGRSRTEGSQP